MATSLNRADADVETSGDDLVGFALNHERRRSNRGSAAKGFDVMRMS